MQRTTFFADVIVPLSVPNKYTYRVPLEMTASVREGARVLVQFGKTRIYAGVVYKVHESAPKDYTAKYIEGVLDEEPVVNELQLKFWDWIAFYYCANPGEVMNAALPSGLKLSSTSHIQINPEFNFEEMDHAFFTDREHQVIDALNASPNLTFENLAEILELKSAHDVVHRLLKKNAVVIYEDVKEKYKPKLESFIRLNTISERELSEQLTKLEKKAFKQAEALLYFLHLRRSGTDGWVKKSELLKKSQNSAIGALVKKNIFYEEHFEVGRLLFEKGSSVNKVLSSQQQRAYDEIKKEFEKNRPVLLHGVTGSGKTEVYIKLISDAVASGKQVLFLIPEIALTTQLITRLRAVFGEIVGVYHSRFSENERVEIWNHVLSGKHDAKEQKYRVILGARSCLFLPFSHLGLIIIDEEHDNSFKQHDPAPRYHARDAALYLATLHKASVLLGSATPSIETMFNTAEGKYGIVHLKNQYVEAGGTTVEICDVNHFTNSNQMKASLTPPLFNAIEKALAKKQQVILFQNRRGFAPYTECRQCGHVPHCIQCDVSLIYHKQHQKLICHYCGYSVTPPKTCSACGSNQLHYKGLGTEKIEEDIEILFPNARTARMDLDSTRSKYAYKQLIDEFESGNIDILVGTQMVTKGLDFNNVNVVGVLNADSILNFPDFRSFEKAYQLITQVRGRAGRSSDKGAIYVQTTQVDHPVLKYIIQNNQPAFYEATLSERRQYNYPPFSRLFELSVISKDANEVNHLSQELFNLLKPAFAGHLLGPEFPLIAKIRNQYHKRILIKVPKQIAAAATRQHVFAALTELQNKHKEWRYKVRIDVDPV
jgi:primosomal protein N' (replication factor Y) (superfamily II helicase)